MIHHDISIVILCLGYYMEVNGGLAKSATD